VRSASKSLTFDPVRGTVTPTATLRVEARDGKAIHQIVNLLGRVRSCSPQGLLAGERAC
jgi:type IV fimbrial biogenesis protein FimT